MNGETPTSRDALHNLCLADPVWAERYQGWQELGHGGSASVIRTHGKATGEDIALKVFPRLSAEDWARFREEVRNAQRLTSPYIVRTYSPFPRGSFAWIELELVDGPSLSQELERRVREGTPFTASETVEIAAAMARALLTAHETGVIHRDVKPANVLLPKSGRPVAKLGDFGISRLAGAARLTKTGLLVGTPQFAAPEIVSGGRGGPAADIYSFSLCLYLMLSNNRPPFKIGDEASPAQWIRAHAEERPLPVARLNRLTPPALADLVERGLAKEPEHRPAAAEVLATLEALGAGRQVSPTAPLLRRRSKRRLVFSAIALAAALTAWGMVLRRAPSETGSATESSPAAPLVLVPITSAAPAPIAPEEGRPAEPGSLTSLVPRPEPRPKRSAAGNSVTKDLAHELGPSPLETIPVMMPEPVPTATPLPTPTPSPTPTPIPVVAEPTLAPPRLAPASPPAALPAGRPSPQATFDLEGILRAKPVAVGRREGLPGQPPLVLVDALGGQRWIWLRFTLEGGADARITKVYWEGGDIAAFTQEPAGGDLRAVVQVARDLLVKRAHLSLEVASGPTYTFALGARWLSKAREP